MAERSGRGWVIQLGGGTDRVMGEEGGGYVQEG
jgi:hypothetical protein